MGKKWRTEGWNSRSKAYKEGVESKKGGELYLYNGEIKCKGKDTESVENKKRNREKGQDEKPPSLFDLIQ